MQRAVSHQWIKDLCLQHAQNEKSEKVAGALVSFLKPNELAQFIVSKGSSLQLYAIEKLDGKLGELHNGNLLQLAQKYDPCGRLIRSFARRRAVMHKRDRATSPTKRVAANRGSPCEDMKALLETKEPSTGEDNLARLLLFFVRTVIELNNRGQHKCLPLEEAAQLLSIRADIQVKGETVALRVQKRPMACCASGVVTCLDGLHLLSFGDSHTSNADDSAGRHALENQQQHYTVFRDLGIKVITLACGTDHTVAITTCGVYAWGSSNHGQVGVGVTHFVSQPEKLVGFSCTDIACGHHHTLAVTADKRLYSWGWGAHGQLGLGEFADVVRPTLVSALIDLEVAAVAGGHSHSLVLTSEGEVYSFGCAAFGQLGTGDSSKQPLPVPVLLIDEPVRLIATRCFHNVIVTTSNAIYVWGVHPRLLEGVARSMQIKRDLKIGAANDCETATLFLNAHRQPRRVPSVLADTIVQVCCSSFHSVLLTDSGHLYSWGCDVDNHLGLCGGGIATTSWRETAVISPQLLAVSGATSSDDNVAVVYAACGADFCIALDGRGRLLAWGKADWLAKEELRFNPTNTRMREELADGASLAHVIFAPKDVTLACGRDLSAALTCKDFWSDAGAGAEPRVEPGILRLSNQPTYNLQVIPIIAKVYLQSFPMLAIQSALTTCGAHDVLAVLLLIQAQYDEAFGHHLKSLSSCRHHLTSSFSQAVAKTIEFYRRLLLTAKLDDVSRQALYKRLMAKAALFAASEGLGRTEQPAQCCAPEHPSPRQPSEDNRAQQQPRFQTHGNRSAFTSLRAHNRTLKVSRQRWQLSPFAAIDYTKEVAKGTTAEMRVDNVDRHGRAASPRNYVDPALDSRNRIKHGFNETNKNGEAARTADDCAHSRQFYRRRGILLRPQLCSADFCRRCAAGLCPNGEQQCQFAQLLRDDGGYLPAYRHMCIGVPELRGNGRHPSMI